MVLSSLSIEFNLMKHSFKEPFLYSFFGDGLKSLIEAVLAFLYVFQFNPLYSHCKSCFFCGVVVSTSRAEVRSYSCFNDPLVERRVRSFEQKCCKYLHTEGLIWVS